VQKGFLVDVFRLGKEGEIEKNGRCARKEVTRDREAQKNYGDQKRTRKNNGVGKDRKCLLCKKESKHSELKIDLTLLEQQPKREGNMDP